MLQALVMARRGLGPHTAWVGVVIKLDDGTTHAVEFVAGMDNFVMADIFIARQIDTPTIVKIEGKGRYWTEGANMGPDVQKPRELKQGQKALEGEIL